MTNEIPTMSAPALPVQQATDATPTPPEYPAGWVKQDPVSLAVAVRTNIVTANNYKDWGIMSVDRGGQYATWDQISGWPDLSVAPPPSAAAGFAGDGDFTAATA